MSKKAKVVYPLLAVLILILIVLFNSTSIIIDYQWFKEVHYLQVFWYKFLTQLKIFGVALVVSFLILYLYSRYIRKEYNKYSKVVDVGGKKKGLIYNVIVLIASVFYSYMVSTNLWNEILMFTHSSSFNVKDPIFKNDISFYILKLPLIEKIYSLSFGLLIFLAFLTALFYFIMMVSNSTYKGDGGQNHLNFSKEMLKPIINKLSIFLLAFFVLLAVGYKIKAYGVLFSSFGNVVGAGYTDVVIAKPFYMILLVLTIAAGILCVVALKKKNYKFLGVVIVALLVINILKPITQGVVQGLIVKPNEIDKEQKYISNNIKYTRKAYKIDKVKQENYTAENNLTARGLKENEELVNNIRINDYRPALQVYNQLQGIRPYYEFNDVDVDRYTFNGKETQVFISAREMNSDSIPSRTWINSHLKYTHGYGVVMSPVNSVTSEGQPKLIIKDIPPTAEYPELKVTRPEIYFGESPDNYIVTNTKLKEFDYPSGDNNKETTYKGTAGIKLNFANRLLFAINKSSMNFIFSGDINKNSKIVLRRNIIDRVKKIAPFLKYDKDPYIVIDKGRLFWILDAYTISNRYPYSQGLESDMGDYNYIRNSAKVVIDAYNGDTKFYISDNEDPIIKVYSKIFTKMFEPISKMPKVLREHLRYPQALFDSQDTIVRKYHVNNPQVFYNNEDVWNRAEQDGMSIESHYLHMKLPGTKNIEFTIMSPYTPRNKQNMVAWLCGRMDDNNYSKLVLYKLPKQQLIYGPKQIEARINQEPSISKELSLWNQQGSSVLRGNVFVVPIGKSLLYIQPLYITSNSKASIPELKRVIVAYKDKIIMEQSLQKALSGIFGGSANQNVDENSKDEGTSINQTVKNASTKELINQASDAFDKATSAQRAGDWAEYGRQINVVKKLIEKLKTK